MACDFWCQSCAEEDLDVPATVTWCDPWGSPYAWYCEDCDDAIKGMADSDKYRLSPVEPDCPALGIAEAVRLKG